VSAEALVNELQPHPQNVAIYGIEDVSGLMDQIVASGWIKPLVVNPANNRIISGHRRWLAVRGLGLKKVPVEYRAFTNETDELEALLLENASRDKTPEQKVNEAEVWESIEGVRAKERQLASLKRGDETPVEPNLAQREKGRTSEKAAAKVGMKKSTYKKSKKVVTAARKLRSEGKTKVAEKLLDTLNHKSVDAAHRELQEYERREQGEQARAQASEVGFGALLPDALTLHCADFRDVLPALPENSVDLIFTDPPYDAESIPLYTDLACHAARVLKPGGSLIAYAGHYALPQLLPNMSEYLRFWWLCAVQHTGGNRRFPGKWVYVGWKPLVWFVKDGRADREFVSDFVRSELDNKDLHDWQQGIAEAIYYIEHLCPQGGTVLDPFMGSGTTMAAVLQLNRRAVGVEVDPSRFAVAKGRLSEHFA
jgi:ParB-like chromosome segregation protein Spo0J